MLENDDLSADKTIRKKKDPFELFLELNDKVVIDFEKLLLLKINHIEIDEDETYFF